MITCYANRSAAASPHTMFGVEPFAPYRLNGPMIGANELLNTLRERGVKNAEIEQLLGLPSSRVSELFSGKRRLQLDEAKKLVEHFALEERVSALSVPIARQLVLYAAESLGARIDLDDPRLDELAREFRAFSIFATDPRVRENEASVEAFFQGLRLSPSRASGASA